MHGTSFCLGPLLPVDRSHRGEEGHIRKCDFPSGVRHPFGEGRTPEASVKQARQLLASIKTDSVYGLRDRSVLGTLIYTGARVGAISRLRMQDLRDNGKYRSLQFAEKGGKAREILVRHDLDEWIATYLDGAGLTDAPQASPLFRAGQRPPAR